MEQLRSGNLLELALLPMLFQILGVSQVGAWNFPASQFSVDEFYPECEYHLSFFIILN